MPKPRSRGRRLEDLPTVLTVPEAAEILRVSSSSAYRAVRAGTLPAIRVGRGVRIPTHRLLDLMNAEAAS